MLLRMTTLPTGGCDPSDTRHDRQKICFPMRRISGFDQIQRLVAVAGLK